MKKKLFSLCIAMVATAYALAQTGGYHYAAAIDTVSKDGFYNIVLTPEINAHLKKDYSDLRIVNDSGIWIPHLIWVPNTAFTVESAIWERKIIRKTINSQLTELIIEGSKKPTSNLGINIKNAAVERYCTLTGSDNMTDWFIINDSINIKPELTGKDISSFKISFPPVAYRYFKVSIKNVSKEPLNILSASSSDAINGPGIPAIHPELENPACIINQKDSAKNSFIQVIQKAHYHFETIALKVSGTKYFNRTATVYIPYSGSHSFDNPGSLLTTIIVSNNSTLEYNVPICNADTFYMVIQNDDNPPLHVEQVKTLAHYTVATAYLDAAKKYRLLLDNSKSTTANFDLQLKDIANKQTVPAVNIGKIELINQEQNKTADKTDNPLAILWLMIALGAVVLGFFTYRLVKELNNKK